MVRRHAGQWAAIATDDYPATVPFLEFCEATELVEHLNRRLEPRVRAIRPRGLRPARGHIALDGAEIPYGWPERMVRLGAAMVPETRDIFPDLTVAENLKLGAFTRRRDAAGVAEDHARAVALFPVLGERAAQSAGTLSGGEQQMLAIARALMSRPRLLLLDEPSLGLAPAIIERIFVMIAELKRSGLTILLVEQNAAHALAIADRAYVLRLGEVAASGPAAEICAATDLKALYLGGRDAAWRRRMTAAIQFVIDVLSLGGAYALMALGLVIVYGILRLVNFAYGELIMVAGYTLFLIGGSPVPWLVMAGSRCSRRSRPASSPTMSPSAPCARNRSPRC